jgi:hypothetical protein
MNCTVCQSPLERRNKSGLCYSHFRQHQADAKSDWSPEEDAALCDVIADGGSFASAAVATGKTKNSVVSRWRKIVRAMGAQAV